MALKKTIRSDLMDGAPILFAPFPDWPLTAPAPPPGRSISIRQRGRL